jgi:carbon storage regulator
MLVLMRRIDEAIIIDGPCRVMVLGVENGRVKLGITADPSVLVLREELATPRERVQA